MWSFLRDHNYQVTKHVTSNVILAAMVMMISVFSFGFENSVLSTIQAMNSYAKQFGGVYNAKKKQWSLDAGHLAYLNSFPLITYALGVVLASQIGERFGRRIVFYGMNCICLVGVAVCYTGRTYTEALVGRMIINIHVGAEAWLIPMWLGEVVPAAVRGAMVALYAFSHIFAGFIAAIITNTTSKYEGNTSWKIPVGVMFAFPTLALLLASFLPESPRWLLRKGRYEKAVEMIYYMYSAARDYPAEREAQLIMETLENAPTNGQWKDLFKRTNTRRTLIGLLASGATQLTGQSFASTYGTIFLKSLMIMDPFTGTMIKRAGLLVGCIFVVTTVDRIGRRRTSLIFGFFACLFLMIMGGLGTIKPPQEGVQKGILAMTIIFPCAYMIAFGSTMQVVKAEIPHTTLRDKSNLLFWLFDNLSNFVATFTLPYLLEAPYADLGSKVGFVYGGTTFLSVILIYFFVPEMTGKSLEEVDEMMEEHIPAWRSRDFKATGISAAVTDLENNHETAFVQDKGFGVEHVDDVQGQ